MTNKKAKGITRKGPKATINKILQEFHEGDKILIKIDSGEQGGMPDPRYHGFTGIVTGHQGKVVKIGLKNGGLEKELLVNPIHLKQAQKEAA